MGKICFAVLVHEKREVIEDMLKNIKKFCPNSDIVLFNGSGNDRLCKGLGYEVCPSSRKLPYQKVAPYMLEIMKWLIAISYKFDYLINLDSDALFARKGFEKFVQTQMKNTDYMAVNIRKPDKTNWTVTEPVQKKWKVWRMILTSQNFLHCFNVGQIYTRKTVKKIVDSKKYDLIRRKLNSFNTFSFEEILYINLVKSLGCKIKEYPKDIDSIRYRPYFTQKELQYYLDKKSNCFLFHPIKRNMDDDARKYIRNLKT